jgi:hypothetical protein
MLLGRFFEYTVSSQAMATDERVRASGGEEEEVHVGCGLQVTGYRLQVTGYRLQVTGYRLQVTGYKLQVTGSCSNDYLHTQ